MRGRHHEFELPPQLTRDDGEVRRVGFELEFSGIGLDDTAAAVQSALGGEVAPVSAAERVVHVASLGAFNVELDWAYLKRLAADAGTEPGHDWLEPLSRAAALLVPVEVVCPPLPMTEIALLSPMVDALRAAGAVGTEESLFAAYGVHINSEIPRLDAVTLLSYLRAFCVLQWWLVDAHAVDAARRVSPYIDLYPEAYLKRVLRQSEATMDEIFADYLEYNASRNRALDLLTILAAVDEAWVRRVVDDARIKPRPAFHYRLPNCHIERPDWALNAAWNTWCVVERLVDRSDDLDALAAAFLAADRPILGVSRGDWVETVDRWLADHGLV